MMMTPASGDRVPDLCTLPAAERPFRVAAFDRFFAESVQRTYRPTRTRLDLLLAAGAEPAGRDLAAREWVCCSFFAFTFDVTSDGPVLHIDVPEAQADVLDALVARADISIGDDRR
jgi:hypothetical protein